MLINLAIKQKLMGQKKDTKLRLIVSENSIKGGRQP
jgi:hypothetical protein